MFRKMCCENRSDFSTLCMQTLGCSVSISAYIRCHASKKHVFIWYRLQ